MSLERTKTISLDFYNNSIVSIDAKQLDTGTRFINIICTDSGKKVYLNADTMSAFVRYKKADGKDVLNDAEVCEDGSVIIELTQQMLAASGRCKLDVLILNESGLKVENLSDISSFYDLGVSVLSTMSFYVNVSSTVIEHSRIVSTNEFDALLGGLSRLVATETHMKELEETFKSNEEVRINSENARIENEDNRNDAEQLRVEAEIKRQDSVTGEAYRIANEQARIAAEIKRQDEITGEAYRIANEEARRQVESERVTAESTRQETFDNKILEYDEIIDNAINGSGGYTERVDDVIADCENSISEADAAVSRINEAIESGAVFQSEKGVANGIATLDENGYIPNEQLNIHQVLFGEADPDDSLGNDGDIYMKIIIEQ